MRHLFTRLARNDDGASAVLLAASLPALMGIAAMAVDLGSIYLAERRLQGVADAAAAAALAGEGDGAKHALAAGVVADSGLPDVLIHLLAGGAYSRDASLAVDARFDDDALIDNAVRVVLRQEVPLFFGAVLTGSNHGFVTAEATAARTDLAGFSLGSRVVGISGGLAGSVLSALAGLNLGLTQADIDLLVETEIDVVSLAEALGPLVDEDGATFGEILDTATPLHVAVSAMADASDDTVLAALLDRIALNLNSDNLVLSDLMDFGPLRDTDVNDGTTGAGVDAYSLLRAMLQASYGDSYEVTLDTQVAGLASVGLRLAGGYGDERSPWLTLTNAGDVTLRTAETRLLINAGTGPIVGLPTSLKVPLYVELAAASATMSDIVCSAGDGSEGVYIAATPSIGKAAIAEVDLARFDDFTLPMPLGDATLLSVPLIRVKAYADAAIGGGVTSTLHFTPDDVARQRTKSVGTSDALTRLASSLVSDVELDVSVGPLTLGVGPVASLVGTTLGTIAPPLDLLVVQLTDVLGVKLGVADVTVDRLRCGQPTIVG